MHLRTECFNFLIKEPALVLNVQSIRQKVVAQVSSSEIHNLAASDRSPGLLHHVILLETPIMDTQVFRQLRKLAFLPAHTVHSSCSTVWYNLTAMRRELRHVRARTS